MPIMSTGATNSLFRTKRRNSVQAVYHACKSTATWHSSWRPLPSDKFNCIATTDPAYEARSNTRTSAERHPTKTVYQLYLGATAFSMHNSIGSRGLHLSEHGTICMVRRCRPSSHTFGARHAKTSQNAPMIALPYSRPWAGCTTHANPTRRLIYHPISSPQLHLSDQILTDTQGEAHQILRIRAACST
ncbi:hypothetical protein IQ06DRAFT_27920 [Phaeosphaeriaceae sp. SRC1lsM3a]|nr:hypothetical protein IQ06DRAFT_27920 [Stagonospora sp. SRC1lsM3a]